MVPDAVKQPSVGGTGRSGKDMSPLARSLAFLAVYVVYLLAGGCIFSAIECSEEISIKKQEAIQEREFHELLTLLSSHLKTVEEFKWVETQKSYTLPRNFFRSYEIPRDYFHNMKSKSKINAKNKVDGETFQCETWSAYNSVFFAFTCVTTIGYGTQTPTTQTGRGACLIYSIIGIPINSILICCIGNFFKEQESTK